MSTKDWLEKDYYKILGVSKEAKPADIKKAFRKIARENHPDQHPGDKKAEDRFKAAAEAHDILSDSDKRKEYDEARSLFGGGGFRFPRPGTSGGAGNMDDLFRNMGRGANDANINDLLGNLFGGSAGTTTRRTTSRAPRRGSDVEGEVTIDFTEAVEGTTVGVQMVSEEACAACRGTGAKAGTVPRVCPTCQGSGMQQSAAGGVFNLSEPCRDCRGRGLLVDEPCSVCHGSGRARSSKSMQVRIPAGVTDGQRIRIKGKGSPGENGGADGDLYVVVHVRSHKVFGRQAHNLTLTAPVTYPEAALGGEIEIPTLKGPSVRLRIPAGTPNGRTFRVRGKGVPKASGEYGDLLVTIEVSVPKNLSDEAKRQLQQYAELASETNPRAGLKGA